MKLVVRRRTTTPDGILGVLEVDGELNCCSLENRALAIPTGTYSIEVTYSPHFHREMPLLDAVPQRTDVRIHPANWPTQLEGCIAVGRSHDADDLNNSDLAFEPLFTLISNALKAGESVTVQILDETAQTGAPAVAPLQCRPTIPAAALQPETRPGSEGFLAILGQTLFSRFHV